MEDLRRFLKQSLRLNQTELQLSEAKRDQLYMIHAERKILSPLHRRFLILA